MQSPTRCRARRPLRWAWCARCSSTARPRCSRRNWRKKLAPSLRPAAMQKARRVLQRMARSENRISRGQTHMADAYIVDAVRTAGGRRNGKLSAWHPADLAGEVLNALLARSGVDPAAIEDVILGCVTQAGEQGFAFARNAVLASRLPESVPAVTIDRQCGSSQQAVQFAAQAVLSGTQDIVIAAGAESMTRVPMFTNASLESIGSVKLLKEGGVISAANASQICDGASAALIVSERALKSHDLSPIARIHSFVVTAGDPVIMLEEPIRATQIALERAGLKIDDIDLYEVNEAFAPVPLAWLQALHADPAKLNVNGGAIALGHPLGASGTKLMATLVHALRSRGKRFGLQTMSEGGGIANVTIVEALGA